MTGDEPQDGYIVEYVAMGNSVKVTALDPVTLKEASIVGDVKAPRNDLARLAVRKLEYVLRKDQD